MIDPERLSSLLAHIDTEMAVLDELSDRDDQDLLFDRTAIRAVKYSFVVAIEAAIDAAEHVIASEGLRAASSFAETFEILREANVLDADLAKSLADAARFRNLLVHGYADVNDERVLAILRTRPPDLRAFREAMASLAAPSARGPGERDGS